jgi:hypothetical protein
MTVLDINYPPPILSQKIASDNAAEQKNYLGIKRKEASESGKCGYLRN